MWAGDNQMTKFRIYNQEIKSQGILKIDHLELSLYSQNKIILKKFKSQIKKFLKDNKLKIVSDEATRRRHHRHNHYGKVRQGFDIYEKVQMANSKKMKLIKIEK